MGNGSEQRGKRTFLVHSPHSSRCAHACHIHVSNSAKLRAVCPTLKLRKLSLREVIDHPPTPSEPGSTKGSPSWGGKHCGLSQDPHQSYPARGAGPAHTPSPGLAYLRRRQDDCCPSPRPWMPSRGAALQDPGSGPLAWNLGTDYHVADRPATQQLHAVTTSPPLLCRAPFFESPALSARQNPPWPRVSRWELAPGPALGGR